MYLLKHTPKINAIYIIVIYLLIILIHFIFYPIIHCEESNSYSNNIKTFKKKLLYLLFINFILTLFFNLFFYTISSALLMGTLSAEILYLIEKIKIII